MVFPIIEGHASIILDIKSIKQDFVAQMTPNTPPNMTASDWKKMLQEVWDPHHIIPSSHQAKWKTAIVFMAHPAFPGMHHFKKNNSNIHCQLQLMRASVFLLNQKKNNYESSTSSTQFLTSPLRLFLLLEPTVPHNGSQPAPCDVDISFPPVWCATLSGPSAAPRASTAFRSFREALEVGNLKPGNQQWFTT